MIDFKAVLKILPLTPSTSGEGWGDKKTIFRTALYISSSGALFSFSEMLSLPFVL